MARHFEGTLQGNGKQVSRTAGKADNMHAKIKTTEFSAELYAIHTRDGNDVIDIYAGESNKSAGSVARLTMNKDGKVILITYPEFHEIAVQK